MKENKAIYFSHDTNASNDPKIINLRVKYGWAAVGIYWAIIETLHKEKDGELPEELLKTIILDFCHQNEEEATKIEKGLYATALLTLSNGIASSKRVKENLGEINDKSEIGRLNAAKRWSNVSKNNATALPLQCKPNAIKESKVKESIYNSEPSSPKEESVSSLQDLYSKMGLPPRGKIKYVWQDEALAALKYLVDSSGKESSVYKCFRDNEPKARLALSDCKELNKPHVLYFLKVYSELIKVK